MPEAAPVGESRDQLDAVRAERDRLARDLAASREREAVLANELQYRVRNALAVTRSIFSRTIETAESVEDVAMHFSGRLDALARYYAQSTAFLRAQVFDLEAMVRDELTVFASSADPRVAIIGPDVKLRSAQAGVLGLALHELTSNSVKFGVLSDQHSGGRLSIEWTLDGDRVTFAWLETGVGIVASAPIASGFGRDYIEQALPYQIGADTRFEVLPGGVQCRIAIILNTNS
ncbi:hypothetical protein AWL63_03690 [Sphingomonas panacis]|uniref:histidine kinase n=2 Tax=Sphingomonas panacis TaxID=1560345 RepID=A0A1B3Z6Z7_9SPHN|nr:hypothetical protein AWL63_03690 [Sphingomonas panacis]